MANELRPMGIGELVHATLSLYRRRFGTFVTISAMVCVPYALLMAVLGAVVRRFAPSTPALPTGYDTSFWSRLDLPHLPQGFGAAASASGAVSWASGPDVDTFGLSPLAFIGTAIVALLGALLFLGLVYPLCQGALMVNISADYLGEELSAADSFGHVFRRLGTLMTAQFLVTLWVLLGVLCCVVPGIVAALWFIVVPAVVLLEDHETASGALRQSRTLMTGNLFRGLLLGLVATVGGYLFESAGGWVIGLIPWPSPFLGEFLENLVQVVTLPAEVGVTVLFYYDLRIRQGSLTLDLLAENLRAARGR